MSGFGYLSRETTLCLDMKQSNSQIDVGFDNDIIEDDSQTTVPSLTNTAEVAEFIVYSATFQVPAFYFSMHDSSGSPLSLKDILRTPFFLRRAFLGAEKTAFALQAPNSSAPLLSQGEHPTLGTPCWYFHPCETPKALSELIEEEKRDSDGKMPDLIRQLELWFLLIGSVVS